jgi:hypothetical protein
VRYTLCTHLTYLTGRALVNAGGATDRTVRAQEGTSLIDFHMAPSYKLYIQSDIDFRAVLQVHAPQPPKMHVAVLPLGNGTERTTLAMVRQHVAESASE